MQLMKSLSLRQYMQKVNDILQYICIRPLHFTFTLIKSHVLRDLVILSQFRKAPETFTIMYDIISIPLSDFQTLTHLSLCQ